MLLDSGCKDDIIDRITVYLSSKNLCNSELLIISSCKINYHDDFLFN